MAARTRLARKRNAFGAPTRIWARSITISPPLWRPRLAPAPIRKLDVLIARRIGETELRESDTGSKLLREIGRQTEYDLVVNRAVLE